MKTILIVDDEEAICDTLADVLRDEGYRCFTAANGLEALEKMLELRPDLVICDVMMPAMDGRETLRRMRSTPELASTPIMMISAVPGILADETVPYSAFLRKPFRLDALCEIVRQLTGGG